MCSLVWFIGVNPPRRYQCAAEIQRLKERMKLENSKLRERNWQLADDLNYLKKQVDGNILRYTATIYCDNQEKRQPSNFGK